jgi:chromosome segregation ATPase
MRASLLEQALFAQRSRLDAAQSSLRVLEQEAVSVAEELALAADAVRESEAAAQVEAEALKGENFVLQSDLSDARVRVAQESAARVAALAEAADVRSQLEVAIEVSRGAEEVAAAAEENAARFRDRSVLLQNHMLQARERCASLLAQLADTTVQLEELTATNVALRAAASASEGAVCALREEVESLQARVVLAKREAGAAEAGLCDARGNIAALTEALAAAQKDEAAAALVGGVNKADVQALREQLASTQVRHLPPISIPLKSP